MWSERGATLRARPAVPLSVLGGWALTAHGLQGRPVTPLSEFQPSHCLSYRGSLSLSGPQFPSL